MNELLASWILIIWFGFTIMFISDKIGFSKWVCNCFKKAKINTHPATQPDKPQQQNEYRTFHKFVNNGLKNVKEFKKRSKQIAKNLNHV